MLATQALYHAGEQAKALGIGVIGPELLLLGVIIDIQTPWPRCMFNRGCGNCTPPSACRKATGALPERCLPRSGWTWTCCTMRCRPSCGWPCHRRVPRRRTQPTVPEGA